MTRLDSVMVSCSYLVLFSWGCGNGHMVLVGKVRLGSRFLVCRKNLTSAVAFFRSHCMGFGVGSL